MAFRGIAAALAGALLLAACEMLGGGKPAACPPVFVVADAAKVTKYRAGGGTDLTDVRFAATVEGIDWACSFDEDGTVDVEVVVDFSAFRGPAADADTGAFQYFVALADPSREILAKRVFDLAVPFEGNASTVGVRRIDGITFQASDAAQGSAHQLYVGFQLDAAELEDNRD